MITWEMLERGGRGERVHTITPEIVGKIFFGLWVLYGRRHDGRIVHRDTILALREQCDEEVPPTLCDALTDAYVQERMISGIVRGCLAQHLDGGVNGELYVVITSIQASHLLRLFAVDFPDEVSWIRERLSAAFPD